MGYVLGLDLGTGSIKGILVDKTGKLVAEATAEYPLYTPEPGYSEQDPAHWLNGADKVISELVKTQPDIKDKLEGISMSGQMHSLVLLDDVDNVVRNAILWNDVRTTKQCKYIEEKLGKTLLDITKNRALEGFTLPKLLWVLENEPENWAKAKTFLLPKDYLGFWLTGTQHMDFSDGAGTLLLDIENQCWSQKIFDTFNISIEMAPKLINSSGKTGNLKKELQEKYGFTNEVAVFAGGADNACAAVGAGILSDDIALCSIGTSGVFLSYENDITNTYNGQLHFFNHAVNDMAYSMGVTLSAGGSLAWYRDAFYPEEPYNQLLSGVNNVAIGCDGLRFAPYIMGERTPYPDAKVRGAFTGINVNHTKDSFGRAVLEGVTFSLKDCQQIMEEVADKKFTTIVSVGGGAKNPDWLQIQADVFDAQIITLEKEEGPAFGAAMIAAVGLGWFESFKACADTFVAYKEKYEPIEKNVEEYSKVYESYQKLYPALKNL